jgi:membrane protein
MAIWELLKQTYRQWVEDGASRLAAALAYYSAVSIAPLLLLIVAVLGLAFGSEVAERELVNQLRSFMGAEGTEFIRLVIENADEPVAGGLASVISLLVLLWGATNVFAELQESLDIVWNVRPKRAEGLWALIRHRVLSFGMVIVIGFLLLVSLALSTTLAAMAETYGDDLPGPDALWPLVSLAVSFAVTTVLFALIYKVLPDVETEWRNVWIGAVFTALLFTIGKSVLALYLTHQGNAYGVAGSVVVFLLWVYYSAQIVFFGAEFTQVYATHRGSGFTVSPDAEPEPRPAQ